MTQIDAVEFYTIFRKRWANEIKKLYRSPRDDKDKQWTTLMLDRFLLPFGESFGYQVIREKGGRVDERWQENGRDVVAIEHENGGENIEYTMNDALKLLSLEAPLKVLITYVSVNKIDWFVRAWTNSLLERLKKRPTLSEFLLILGGDYVASYPSDWFATLFRPTYEARPLFYSARSHEEKEEDVNRWVSKEH